MSGPPAHLAAATRAWLARVLRPGERVVTAEVLGGGWTSDMRLLRTTERELVLRSFTAPFFRRHAPGLLTREADVLRLLDGSGIPAAQLVAVDPTGAHCAAPSLLMTRLPGTLRLGARRDTDRGTAPALADLLTRVHGLRVDADDRPRAYQAWTGPERVAVPPGTARPGLWRRAVAVIDREPPAYEGRFLHRDFHPGNVLFTPEGRVGGVVDWVETSWGPADLDVAHCATALALLHGPDHGLAFADLYEAAGGVLTAAPDDHLYWRLLDALAFAPDAERVATPWRTMGRTDLTPQLLTDRLEHYVAALLDRYGTRATTA
ncbi:phosphotransferase family protein [Streptomyces avicenniae]|uniref:phosphotransferase family protein n=1 Tax=Streptomyces avicenniae TaxID=500153 RepID=UPI000699D8A1|nr:aminoglycoside phosphotransferase family protein [Streptomyces avicenniae]